MNLRYLAPPVGHVVIASVRDVGWCAAVWDGRVWQRLTGPDETTREPLPPPSAPTGYVIGWVYVTEFIAHHATTSGPTGPIRREDLDALLLRIDGLRALADNIRTRFLAAGADAPG